METIAVLSGFLGVCTDLHALTGTCKYNDSKKALS